MKRRELFQSTAKAALASAFAGPLLANAAQAQAPGAAEFVKGRPGWTRAPHGPVNMSTCADM